MSIVQYFGVSYPPYFCDGSRLTSPWFRLSGRLLEVNLPRVPAHFHRQRRTVFAVRLRFYSSLDPAQVLARKTCLFSIRFVLNGHLFNLIIVRLLNPVDILYG